MTPFDHRTGIGELEYSAEQGNPGQRPDVSENGVDADRLSCGSDEGVDRLDRSRRAGTCGGDSFVTVRGMPVPEVCELAYFDDFGCHGQCNRCHAVPENDAAGGLNADEPSDRPEMVIVWIAVFFILELLVAAGAIIANRAGFFHFGD